MSDDKSIIYLQDENFDEMGRPKKIKREFSDWIILKRIIQFINKGKYRKILRFLIFLSICGSFLGFYTPFIIRNIVEQGLGGGGPMATLNPELIRKNIIYLGISLFINIFVWFGENYSIQTLANRSMYEMRKELFYNLQSLSFDYYDSKEQIKGKIISYVTNDVETIQELVGSGILTIMGSTIGLIGSLILMILISWQLTLVTFSLIPLLLVVGRYVFKNARRYFILMRRRVAAVTGHLNESIMGMRVIKAFAVEEKNYYKFDVLTDAELSVNLKAQKLFSLIPSIMVSIIGSGLAIILIYGSNLVIQESLGTGDILAFVLYLMGFMSPLISIFQLFSIVQNTMAAGERIIKIIDTKPKVEEDPNSLELGQVKGEIKFSGVNFEYLKNQPIIKNFSLKIKPKERIAIIGYTGAGKTTLINLIERFYDVNKGKITIDGINIKNLTISSLRSNIGLVFQDNLLFSGTVNDNIRYGKPGASDNEIIDVCKKVGAHEYILDLPNGYDSEVREFGNLLSVGQKQLIAFARALILDPPILIMDEATSAVDPYSEIIIQRTLETLLKNRTSITIAHRLSTIINSDRIIVLDKGQIVETGTHQQLMEKRHLYRHLFLMQFKNPLNNENFKNQ
ncbi:MAG: ABC transporter ATP-binding protein [Promethearchaeota archaeon]